MQYMYHNVTGKLPGCLSPAYVPRYLRPEKCLTLPRLSLIWHRKPAHLQSRLNNAAIGAVFSLDSFFKSTNSSDEQQCVHLQINRMMLLIKAMRALKMYDSKNYNDSTLKFYALHSRIHNVRINISFRN